MVRLLSHFLCSYLTRVLHTARHGLARISNDERALHIVSHDEIILGDPGAVSRLGRKGGTKVFKFGRKSPWVPTLTKLFPKIQADTGSWLGTKYALYYCAQSANSFSWGLFVSSYTTAIVSPHLPGSFTKLLCARETFIFYFPIQKRRNYRWVEKTFGMLSAGAIQFAPRIFCFWRITMYRK